MKILMVNKFHYLKGGSEKYYFDLASLLKDNGHEVAFFSMKDEKNIKTDCKEYFVEPIDLNTGSKLKAFDVIYSKDNKKKMEEALEDFKPDIVHLNNFQRQLSVSIIEPIKKRKIPIVFTAHDIQAICPASTMLDSNKNICEKCMNGKYINCVKKKCNKGSTLKSLLGAIEARYYRKKKIYSEQIDKIISPSYFYKTKLIQDGIGEEKIEVMHNFVDTKQYDVELEDVGYALYVGRLSREKGVLDLIDSFSKLNVGKLYVAGEGNEKENILEFIKQNKLQERIELLGFLKKDEVIDTTRKCSFIVVPSIGYENCPYSIIETMAIGKPVIGANVAGIPELVKDGHTGFIYEKIDELSEKMKILFSDKKTAEEFGKNAKMDVQKLYAKEVYYEKIMDIYSELIKRRK